VSIVNNATLNETNSIDKKNVSSLKKRHINFSLIIGIVMVILAFFGIYSYKMYRDLKNSFVYRCTPITSKEEEESLDLKSTLVQDLYSKVATSIREDIAQPEFNDTMKLYLAYRQILERDKYDSNCNLFDNVSMEPYTCNVTANFRPKAFKEETLLREIKKLFGEETNIPLSNIKLENSCIGGYQYIKARGEFVQGECNSQTATSFKATKSLKKAISTGNTIILTEEVKYHENEKMPLPNYLKSGIYYYTFRLDMNYNYVLVSKKYESKY